MSEAFKNLFPAELLGTPYENNEKYLNDEFKRILMLLNHYLCAKENDDFSSLKNIALDEFDEASFFTKSRLNLNDDKFFPGKYVKEIYSLSELEWFCLLISILTKLDKKYLKMFLKIESEENLSYSAVLKLYFFVSDISEISDYYCIYTSIFEKMNSLCFDDSTLNIDECLFENIMSNAERDIDIPGVNLRLPQRFEPLLIRENTAQKMCDFFKKSEVGETVYYYIHGEEGIGKKTLVKRACDILEKGLIYIDLKQITSQNGSEVLKLIVSAYREALFNKSFILLDNFECVLKSEEAAENHVDFILSSASNFSKVVFVLANENVNIRKSFEKFCFIDLHLEGLTNEESFKIWSAKLSKIKLSKNVDINEIANKFTFTPKQIKNAVLEAQRKSEWGNGKSVDKFLLCDAAYSQVTSNLSDKAVLIKKKHTWDELVMHHDQKEMLKQACDQIKYKHIVFDKWGLKNRVLYGSGLSMLFTGPPGTGKTMAAQVVTSELGLEMYKVDLSKVVSKYIGESEKNLGEIFESAKKSNVILLFDETDALFGKRTEVKDSHDKNANLETSYLLQKMEEYNGITVMTTNFSENIDKAFFRRINYVVHFAFPDASARQEIWSKMYPKETPLSNDIDFKFLAQHFELSGGSIKNVAVTSAFMAAANSKKVKMEHIIKALEYEIKKQGKMVSKSDFSEYGYLL